MICPSCKIIMLKCCGNGRIYWYCTKCQCTVESTSIDFDLKLYEYRIKPEENYTIEQNCGENRIEGGVLSISGSVSEGHTCKECVGETVFKGKKAYCKKQKL